MHYKNLPGIVLIIFLILTVTSCASAGVVDYEPGFLTGLWDGLTIIYSLLGSIFDSSINLIAENNNGFFYYLGWGIGLLISIPMELIFLALIFTNLSGG
jgi:hypothetical protein